MIAARWALALANLAVSALNVAAAMESRDARDVLAALAWAGSGTFWAWTAMGGGQ